MNKNLLIIAYHFPPCALSGTYRTFAWVRLLTKRGWNITLLTVNNPEPPLDKELLKKVPSSIKILRTPYINPLEIFGKFKKHKKSDDVSSLNKTQSPNQLSQPYQLINQLTNIKDWLSWWLHVPDSRISWLPFALLKTIKVIKKNKISLIYSTSPYTTAHLIAGLAKKITKLPWVADFRDPWRANPFRNIPYKIHDQWDKFLESWVIKQTDHIICVTEYMKRDFINRYPFIKNKISYIPNGYDPEDYENLKPLREFDKNYFVLTHAGTFYGPRSPISIFKALNFLKKKFPELSQKIRLQLIGNPFYNEEHLENIAVKFGIKEMVKVIPTVPKYKALCYLKGSDALLLVGFKGKGAEIQVPAKLYEYFAIKKPILVLAPSKSAITETFYTAKAPGEICEPDDINGIANKLKKLMERKFYKTSFQIEKFNRRNLVTQLDKILKDTLKNSKRR